MINDFDLEDDREYPEELYSVVELSDSILELTEKLELIPIPKSHWRLNIDIK